MIGKIKVKYRQDGKSRYDVSYKQKTIELEIPTNEYGFTLTLTLSKNIDTFLKDYIVPNNAFFKLLSFQIISVKEVT